MRCCFVKSSNKLGKTRKMGLRQLEEVPAKCERYHVSGRTLTHEGQERWSFQALWLSGTGIWAVKRTSLSTTGPAASHQNCGIMHGNSLWLHDLPVQVCQRHLQGDKALEEPPMGWFRSETDSDDESESPTFFFFLYDFFLRDHP